MKYKLLSPHYIDQQVLPEGTIVGDTGEEGVVFYDGLPSKQMIGLDSESRNTIKNLGDLKDDERENVEFPEATEENTGGPIQGRPASPMAPRPDSPNTPNPNSIGDIAPSQPGGLGPDELGRRSYSESLPDPEKVEAARDEAERKAEAQQNPPKVPTSNPASEPNLKVGQGGTVGIPPKK